MQDDEKNLYCGIIFLYGSSRPTMPVSEMLSKWHSDKVLCEYKRPQYEDFLEVLQELKSRKQKP